MKKLSTLLFLCLIAMVAYAGPVSRSQALRTAQDYLQQRRFARGTTARPVDLTLAYECLPKSVRSQGVDTPLYYVFNQGDRQGFLVVAGDDRMKPVLGYVDEGTFDLSSVHDNLKWWLQALESTMVSVVSTTKETPMQLFSDDEDLKETVEPLVKVKWGQYDPYYDRCPFDEVHNKQSLVGCTAVAMAQVLSKWKYPAQGHGAVDYVTYTHKMRIMEDLSTFKFDWDKMLPSYEGNRGTAEERDAVAQLMYACGVSMKMDYCSNASGTFLRAAEFEKYFDLASTCNEVQRVYYTREAWDRLIKEELSAGRPVVYNGFSMSAGHAFVCDGYDSDGLFHINWGWNGSLNGYFALAELNSAAEHAGAPSDNDGNYNLDQSVVYGIQPSRLMDEDEVVKEKLYFSHMRRCVPVSKNNVKVTLEYVATDGNGFKGLAGMGVYDGENHFLGIIGNPVQIDLNISLYYKELTFGGRLPASVEDGVYTVRPVCQMEDGEYEPMVGRKGSGYVNYMTLKVKGNKVDLENPDLVDAKISLVDAKAVSEKVYAGGKNVLEITLRNDGAMYNGPISLLRYDGDKQVSVFDNNYILESGQEVTLKVKVRAPEGVKRDSLEVWMAGGDNDVNYNNGFVYKKVDGFGYDLIVPTPGAPEIQLYRLVINNKEAHAEKYLSVDLTLTNAGGFYSDKVTCFVFPENGGNSLASGQKDVFIDKGDTLSLNIQIPISDLKDGTYFFMPYLWLEGNWANINSDYFYFTKSTQGSFMISNKEMYSLFHVDYPFEVPEDIKCGVVTAADTTGMSIDFRYEAGDVVPAGTPVILKAEKRKSYKYTIVESEELAPADNLLRVQTDEKGYTYAGEGDYLYYSFTHDGSRGNYGFYLVGEGKPYRLVSKKCYLALPRELAKMDGYPFAVSETGIEGVVVDGQQNVPSVIYTLSGVRVNAPFHELPKGIYIVNGKKVMK